MFETKSLYELTIQVSDGILSSTQDLTINVKEYVPCFEENTQILCPTGFTCIKDLKKGDTVNTYKHGIKKIIFAGIVTAEFNNDNGYVKNMYRMKKTDGMTNDLIVTGRHSILVDNWSSFNNVDKREQIPHSKIDDKFLLVAGLSSMFNKETEVKNYTVYHIALEGDQPRYGIYANGILMESLDNRNTNNIIEDVDM